MELLALGTGLGPEAQIFDFLFFHSKLLTFGGLVKLSFRSRMIYLFRALGMLLATFGRDQHSLVFLVFGGLGTSNLEFSMLKVF